MRMFDDPPVIDVFEHITGDLLLVGAASTIWVAHGVDMGMRVEPAGTPPHVGCVSQCDLRTIGHMQWLPLGQCCQTTLQHTD